MTTKDHVLLVIFLSSAVLYMIGIATVLYMARSDLDGEE